MVIDSAHLLGNQQRLCVALSQLHMNGGQISNREGVLTPAGQHYCAFLNEITSWTMWL